MVNGELQNPPVSLPAKQPAVLTEGGVGPSAGLDSEVEKHLLLLTGIEFRPYSPSLYRMGSLHNHDAYLSLNTAKQMCRRSCRVGKAKKTFCITAHTCSLMELRSEACDLHDLI
jgi:hypothetical protein